ncbi:MAG TPA: metallophosphoesterase [Paucimonas sp.]|nr:metallophosphoesterase [Paucimonas sp.]
MKIQIASDLHLEFLETRFPGYRIVEPAPGADVLVLAGDIHHASRAVGAFGDWPVPVVYVHGNHELYHQQYDRAVANLRAASGGGAVRFLECNETVLGGVRFLGCCLWTDYRLYPGAAAEAMREAERRLADHRAIRVGERFFGAQDALERHGKARAWLAARLAEDHGGKTVVVTHHAPLNAAFASDLAPLLERADLWIHGHVHDSFDYRVGRARVVANPRGYMRSRQAASPREIEWENPAFDAMRVIDLGTP